MTLKCVYSAPGEGSPKNISTPEFIIENILWVPKTGRLNVLFATNGSHKPTSPEGMKKFTTKKYQINTIVTFVTTKRIQNLPCPSTILKICIKINCEYIELWKKHVSSHDRITKVRKIFKCDRGACNKGQFDFLSPL